MKKKMGRPRLSARGAAVVFSVRLPPEEAQTIKAAIRASGETRPDWLRNALVSAANRK
jgi:hypothetical protein